jgi:hypothetical protein
MLLDGIGMTYPGGTAQDREWWDNVRDRISNR